MQKPRIRQDNVLAEEVQGECVVYDSGSKKAHHLNSTLSWVWKHCDGTHTIEDLTTAMQRDLGGKDASGIVVTGLKQLADANLLEPKSFDPHYFVPGRSGGQQAFCHRRRNDCRARDQLNPCSYTGGGKIETRKTSEG